MDELQIGGILSQLPWTKDSFHGVYASDTMPKKWIKRRPCNFVVNLSKEDQRGSHWVAIHLDADGYGEYFCPYGFPPLTKTLLDFLNHQTKRKWTYNSRQLQSAFTSMCGGYCIFYLMYKSMYNLPMNHVLEIMFPKGMPYICNDIKIQRSLKQRFKLYILLIATELVKENLSDLYS